MSNQSTRTLSSFLLSVAVTSLLVLGVAQCVQGCALLAAPEDFDEGQARTELALYAGDARAIAAAFEESKPDVAAALLAFADALDRLSVADPLDPTAALVALGGLVATEQRADDEEFSAYYVLADVLLRRVAAYAR